MTTITTKAREPLMRLVNNLRLVLVGLVTAGLLASCSTAAGTPSAKGFDASTVHSFSVRIDKNDFADMVAVYKKTGKKEWIRASIAIDGKTFDRVGIRLKGNSSLHTVSAESDPTDLPWLIQLDKYLEGQSLDGYTQFVVRSSSNETPLNEAVALDLLRAAGLASSRAVAARFSVNGGKEKLRLVVQNLDDTWEAENFNSKGILYKAEAGGNYSYRGKDPQAYADAFDQETDKDKPNLKPLIDFLDFINNSSDDEFNANLAKYLDVQAFANYLAFQDLIENFDDIDGLGNNSFLRYDEESGRMTVVAWDHNLAFGSAGMGGGTPPDGGKPPAGLEPPGDTKVFEDMQGREGPQAGGPGSPPASNVLVKRFKANKTFNALYDQAMAELRDSLYGSHKAKAVLDRWVKLLNQQANDLVDEKAVTSDARAISDVFNATRKEDNDKN
jgi:spore coat protein CotH